MAGVTVTLQGWGVDVWDAGAWGETGAGQVGTASVGSGTTVTGAANVNVTGLAATGSVGTVSVTVIYHETVNVTGVVGTGQVGSAVGSIPVTVPLQGWGVGDWGDSSWGYSNAGSVGTTAVGTAIAMTEGTVNLTGLSATTGLGTVSRSNQQYVFSYWGSGNSFCWISNDRTGNCTLLQLRGSGGDRECRNTHCYECNSRRCNRSIGNRRDIRSPELDGNSTSRKHQIG